MKTSFADPSVKAIVKAAFPNYRGRKIRVTPETYPVRVESYWDGGTRSYFAVVRLADLKTMPVRQNGTPFDGGSMAPEGVIVPQGFVIVEHIIFCGRDCGIDIHTNPADMPKWLPEEER